MLLLSGWPLYLQWQTLYPTPHLSPRASSSFRDPMLLLHFSQPGPFFSALSLCLVKAGKMGENGTKGERWRNRVGAKGLGPQSVRMVPALLLQSPRYPLYLMEPVQDALIHLQEGRRHSNSLDGSSIQRLWHWNTWCPVVLGKSTRYGYTRGSTSLGQALRFQKFPTVLSAPGFFFFFFF